MGIFTKKKKMENTETTVQESKKETSIDKAAKVEKQRLDDLVSIAKKEGLDKAMKIMKARIGAEEQIIEIDYEIKAFQHEGAYAISQAVERVLGRFDMSPSGASGNRPPQLINITLPNGKDVKAPWGTIKLPGFDEDCYIELDYDWDDSTITIEARIRKRYEEDMKKIIDITKEILASDSIYLGEAIELDFDNNGYAEEPSFMDLSTINEDKILFSKNIKDGLLPILARIKDTERCREQGLDIKLGVLMEGIYGTGKTLVAFWLGKIAREYGWTFIYLKHCKDAAKALKIAENYARKGNGVILFTEDIDQVIRGERGSQIQDIVNTLDGGDTKNLPIISIFTTNHIEVIEPTFLRGKRIGSLINFGVLDIDTAQQFIDKLVVDNHGKSLMVKGDTSKAAEALCGIVPAFASEVIDKAKAYMISREAKHITNEDIIIAAESYKKQIEFAECRKIDTENELPKALGVVAKAMGIEKFGGDGSGNKQEILMKIRDVFDHVGNR